MAQRLLRCKPPVGVASNKDRIAARFLISFFIQGLIYYLRSQ